MVLTQLTFLFFLAFCHAADEKPLVQTPLGTIKGFIKKSFEGKDFAAFEGIPYAKPPNGARRFEPPEPVEPWLGVWNATNVTECAQVSFMRTGVILGSEDCLHINVYVPRTNPNPNDKLEVIVHIHGGAYMIGSGHMYSHPEFLIDKDAIFVTFNYRLGILGFLSTEDEVVPGNNGMKDQVLALDWIQKNIASFGGNPNSVTLTGLSAGGASVHLHYFSEMSKGLFHRGFSQSGVALNSFSLQEGALEKAKILAEAVGCSFENTRVLVDCLKQRPFEHILNKLSLFYAFGVIPLAPFAPVVEKGSKAFLAAHPFELLQKGQVYDVPWISSNTLHEGYMIQMFLANHFDNIGKNWASLAPFILDFNYTLDKSSWEGASEKIKKFYFGEKEINEENVEIFAQMFGDRIFLVDAETAVRLQAKATKSPVYYYYFSYPGDDSKTKFVSHGADGRYFYSPVLDPKPLTQNELKMKDILTNMLISYAKTGTPSIDGVDWKPTKYEKLTYLDVISYKKEDIVLKTVDELTPRKFWKSLQLLENDNLFHVKDEL